jgi:hypothetical protein
VPKKGNVCAKESNCLRKTLSKTHVWQDKLFYIKWLWRHCAIWLFRNAGGASVLSWLIEQLPLIQCCQGSRKSCSISTRKTGSDLHNHVAGTTPSNDSSVFLETAKCKIKRTIFLQVGRILLKKSLISAGLIEVSV